MRPWAAALCGIVAACAAAPTGMNVHSGADARALAYLHDPAFRRARLDGALVTDGTYATLRRAEYDAWSALPELAPTFVPALVATGALDAATLARARDADPAALRALGRAAFFSFPVQEAPSSAREGVHGMQHLVRDDAARAWLTCATCHARGGIAGAPNVALDFGAVLVDAFPHAPSSAYAIARSWGPGRVDVTTHTGTEPARIPDLRPVRFESQLQWSGGMLHRDVVDLALRIETLVITSNDQRVRPSLLVSLALATYVESLADALPAPPPLDPSFAKHCGGCHDGVGLSGGWIDAADVGTDTTLARSAERGTGGFRVPSLRGVATRGPLMHDGSLRLETLLDATRASGHRYGLDATDEERAAIAAFLRAL